MKNDIDNEVRRALFWVYSHMVAYSAVLIGVLTLFKIVFEWPVPVLGVLIFLTLLFVHLYAMYMLSTPIRQVGLARWFYYVSIVYLAFLFASLALAL